MLEEISYTDLVQVQHLDTSRAVFKALQERHEKHGLHAQIDNIHDTIMRMGEDRLGQAPTDQHSFSSEIITRLVREESSLGLMRLRGCYPARGSTHTYHLPPATSP
jgi:hypothetical protein